VIDVHRTVPIARRNLFHDGRRAALSIAGIAVALLLVLVLDGIFAGSMERVTAYIRGLPADLIVSQRGVRTMHMSSSSLPADTVERARGIPGVAWAEAIRFTTVVVASDRGSQLSYVIGVEPGGRGGPRRLVTGHEPRAGEVVLDRLGAGQLHARVGDNVRLLGRTFTVSGLTTGLTNIVNSTVFITAADNSALRGPGASYVLVGLDAGSDPATVQRRLVAALAPSTIQTRAEFAAQERMIVRDMSADLMRIITIVGFATALAVVALTLFSTTLTRLRDYGIMSALGSRHRRLAAIVVGEALWSVGLAFLAALILAIGLGHLLDRIQPSVHIAIETSGALRTAIGALIVALVGALLPLRRVVTVDPATAFRSGS
jgi:putative ABC transport system permease protein